MTEYPLVPLSEVLTLRREEVSIQVDETYRTAGIYSFGKGLFERPTISGSETRYRSYFKLREGQFVYSRLFAWEGAVAVVSPEFDGLFVSQEFPTFDVDSRRALPEYLAAICRWPEFHASVAGGTKGLGLRRQRVHPDQLLKVTVPLPDLDEQRRIVARLESISDRADELQQLVDYSARLSAALAASATSSSAPHIEVGGLVSQVKRAEPVVLDRTYRLLGARWYAEGLFVREEKPGSDLAAPRVYRVRESDFVYNRLFAWKGSFALVEGVHDGFHVSNEFPTFEIHRERVEPEYLLAVFAQPTLWSEALSRSAGGTPTSRNRLREDRFLKIRIPLPPIDEQRRIAELVSRIRELTKLREAQMTRMAALRTSALNWAFAGQL